MKANPGSPPGKRKCEDYPKHRFGYNGGKKALGGSAYIDWLYAGNRPLVKLEDCALFS